MIEGTEKGVYLSAGPPYPDLFAGRDTPIMAPAEAVCLGCGCSDMTACEGGRAWNVVDYDAGVGACSSCPEGWGLVVKHLDDITARPRNESVCLLCGAWKVPLIARLRGEIVVAVRFCEVCWL